MRLNIHFIDRIGIFQEMLLVFAERCLNVAVVEVDSPNIYIDVPDLTRDRFPAVREALAQVSGVQDIVDVDMLPGMRRRLYLDALLAAIADPVLAVGAGSAIIVANAATTHVEREHAVARGERFDLGHPVDGAAAEAVQEEHRLAATCILVKQFRVVGLEGRHRCGPR